MKLAGRIGQWWVRGLFFAVCMTLTVSAAILLDDMRPTLSIGRGLEGLDREDMAAMLALADQIKTNRHIPKSPDLLIQDIPQAQEFWSTKFCAGHTPMLRDLVDEAKSRAGRDWQVVRCSSEVGYIFGPGFRNDTYQAGFHCVGWCGSGNIYRLTTLGSISILFRVGVWMN